MKIHGIVPARMASSRFPGKPLYPICGKTMIEHVYERAKLFKRWDTLHLATCDEEIAQHAKEKSYAVVMTANTHERCLDRVAEAINKGAYADSDDIIVCVQGDEPMLHPEMIAAVVKPLEEDESVHCTMLAMKIVDEAQFLNPDIVKVIHDLQGNVLYTSRSPIPYCKQFTKEIGAKRVSGIFAFRWHFLQTFNELPASPLEQQESCDSNRIIDYGFKQRIAPYEYQAYFSVDSPRDIALVEKHMQQDPLWGQY